MKALGHKTEEQSPSLSIEQSWGHHIWTETGGNERNRMKPHAPHLDVSSDAFARRQDRFLRAAGIWLAAAFIVSTIVGFDAANSKSLPADSELSE